MESGPSPIPGGKSLGKKREFLSLYYPGGKGLVLLP